MKALDIQKKLNDNTTFLTVRGLRKPKYIFIGVDNFGNKIKSSTKKGCIMGIEMNNRVFNKRTDLLKQ